VLLKTKCNGERAVRMDSKSEKVLKWATLSLGDYIAYFRTIICLVSEDEASKIYRNNTLYSTMRMFRVQKTSPKPYKEA